MPYIYYKPYAGQNGTKSICVTSCGPSMVADGRNCIKVEDCKKPVLSHGKCMELCDDGYLYVTFGESLADDWCDEREDCRYTSKNIGQKICVKKEDLVLKLAGSVIGIILYMGFLLIFFSTRRFQCSNLIVWIKNKKHMPRSPSHDELLCNNVDVLDDGGSDQNYVV